MKDDEIAAGKTRRLPLWIALGVSGAGAIAALLACTTLSKITKEPIARLERVDIADPNAEGATLLFAVSVENPNEVAIEVDSLDYALEIEGKPFAKGSIDEKSSVPALGKTTLKVPVRVRYSDLFASVLDFLQAGSRKYRLSGGAKFGWIRIPFEKSGEVKLQGGL